MTVQKPQSPSAITDWSPSIVLESTEISGDPILLLCSLLCVCFNRSLFKSWKMQLSLKIRSRYSVLFKIHKSFSMQPAREPFHSPLQQPQKPRNNEHHPFSLSSVQKIVSHLLQECLGFMQSDYRKLCSSLFLLVPRVPRLHNKPNSFNA